MPKLYIKTHDNGFHYTLDKSIDEIESTFASCIQNGESITTVNADGSRRLWNPRNIIWIDIMKEKENG